MSDGSGGLAGGEVPKKPFYSSRIVVSNSCSGEPSSQVAGVFFKRVLLAM